MEKDYIIKDPAPFKAIDGSYHGDMKSVEAANELYWSNMMKSKINSNLDLPLTEEQLRQIINHPSYRSLVSVLQDGLSKQYNKEEKGMKR